MSAHLAGVRPNIRLGKVRYTLRFEVACQCSLLPVSSFVVRVTHTSDSRKIAVFHNPAYELENQVYPGSSGCFLSFSLSLSPSSSLCISAPSFPQSTGWFPLYLCLLCNLSSFSLSLHHEIKLQLPLLLGHLPFYFRI